MFVCTCFPASLATDIVLWMMVSNTLAIVSVDNSGLELRAELLIKMKECPLIVSHLRLVWAADVINTLLVML